ncbi:MAG: cellulose biosynthesis cyclic di-GMP-binding regulatory protein BcsB [Mangrovibacterium sp.]
MILKWLKEITIVILIMIFSFTGLLAFTKSKHIVFEDDLLVEKDIEISGATLRMPVVFTKPKAWVVDSLKLHLFIEHSELLLGDYSTLTVSLNKLNLKTIRLDERNTIENETVVSLPPEFLDDHNILEFIVEQHYVLECEDPFSPALWTSVSNRSYLEVDYSENTGGISLERYPFPVFDDLGYGIRHVHYIVPPGLSIHSMQNLVNLNAGIAREIGNIPMKISTSPDVIPDAPNIAVGLLAELPGYLLPDLLTNEKSRSPELWAGKKRIKPQSGIIWYAPNPANPLYPILVVTGHTKEGLEKGVQALLSHKVTKSLSGEMAVIDELEPFEIPGLRVHPNYVPENKSKFSLAELGMENMTGRGLFAAPATIVLKTHPDVKAEGENPSVEICYSYGSQLHPAMSDIEIRFNSTPLRSVPLNNPSGEEEKKISAGIPNYLIRPLNKLEIVFHLYPEKWLPCEKDLDNEIWATVLSEKSTVNFPHYFSIEMPDLGAFQYDGFPYTLYPDMRDVVCVLPDKAEQEDVEALLNLTAFLGKHTYSPVFDLQVLRGNAVEPKELRNKQVIVLGTEKNNSFTKLLKDELEVFRKQEKLKAPEKRILNDILNKKTGFIEEIPFPDIRGGKGPGSWIRGKFYPLFGIWSKKMVLVVYPDQEKQSYELLRKALIEPGLLSKVKGNIVAYDGAEISALSLGKKVNVGKVPINIAMRHFVARSPYLSILFIFVATFFVYFLIRIFIKNRKTGN